jgi:uncharacterized protein (DUF736 family)
MPTISEQAIAKRRKQQPDFIVRARTGPGTRDWTRIGSAWRRDNPNGGEVITVVLSALPITVNNRVTMKLLKAIEPEDTAADEFNAEDPSTD